MDLKGFALRIARTTVMFDCRLSTEEIIEDRFQRKIDAQSFMK